MPLQGEQAMRTLVDQLATYATYHRDPRNIATHFVGVPIIVLSVLILLSRVSVDVAGIAVTPALVVFLLSSLFYLKLSLAYGLAMFVILFGVFPQPIIDMVNSSLKFIFTSMMN